MNVLLLVPAVLATLVLGAHFLRAGALPLVVILIGMLPLLGWRRSWVPRLFQAVLGLGALEWLRTLLALRQLRAALGQPHARMTVILGGVAVFTLLAAVLFEAPRLKRRYRRSDPSGAR